MTDYTTELTDEQSAALVAFADAHASRRSTDEDYEAWRIKLGDCWMKASYPYGALHPHALQQVRNQFGPTWLFDHYNEGWRPTLPAWEKFDPENKTRKAGVALWSGEGDPPAIAAQVCTRVGPGIVTGYFVQDDFLGVLVRLTERPEWMVKQRKGLHPVHLFGAELRAG